MLKKVITGILLIATLLLCACNSQPTVPDEYNLEQAAIYELVNGTWICETECAYIRFYLPENASSEWDYHVRINCDKKIHPSGYTVNDFARFELGIPQYHYPMPENEISDTETAVYFHSRDGEFSTGGLLIVDNAGTYIKFALQDDYANWYTFYPYEQETPVNQYICVKSMINFIQTETEIQTLEDDALRQSVLLLLNNYGVEYFYEVSAIPMHGTYQLELYCLSMNYEYPDQDRDLVFFIDETGNPIREDQWTDSPHQSMFN